MPSHRVTLSTLVDLAEQLDPTYGILQSAPQSNGTRRYALIAYGERGSQRYIDKTPKTYYRATELKNILQIAISQKGSTMRELFGHGSSDPADLIDGMMASQQITYAGIARECRVSQTKLNAWRSHSIAPTATELGRLQALHTRVEALGFQPVRRDADIPDHLTERQHSA